MLLRSIELHNFRQFIDEKIDFSTDPDRNVTLVIGDNGTGKTTFAQAFTWCLYGETDFSNKVMLNRIVAEKMTPDVLVKGDTWMLSDFGLCEFLDPEEHQDITRTNEKIGPAFWMSPEAVDNYYWGTDSIGTYSDVFQLCAVFAFVLMRKHPGGILSAQNDLNTTPAIKRLIIDALSNEYTNRPADGHALVQRYSAATYDAASAALT